MNSASTCPEYSIAAVSKLTGVGCHALRVWERRYQFPVPHRSAAGHRRYSHEQVEILREIATLIQSGRSIGEVILKFRTGRLLINPSEGTYGHNSSPSMIVDKLVAGDASGADALLDIQAELYSPLDLVERVIDPALVDVGERWYRKECSIFQERHAVSILYGRLSMMVDSARRANPRPKQKILVGTLQGDRHEGGVLMVCLAMELAGWRAVSMGIDLPIREYQRAINAWRPDALALSFVLSRNINKRFVELSEIRGVPIFVGGRSIVNHQGLARRYGLIPLAGSVGGTARQLATEVERLAREHPSPARESLN